ncbi:hypothetical protein LOD99_10088 [Oopsacas minuta]|uniref:VLIG-type G domain-containing protein n=1 Tax=Oopsacas minuta TaxID=111878 RepID=A0AAV7KIS6_9METZ|nr:hypothetical protein LOD99_10088 [Oopsacas minuta]
MATGSSSTYEYGMDQRFESIQLSSTDQQDGETGVYIDIETDYIQPKTEDDIPHREIPKEISSSVEEKLDTFTSFQVSCKSPIFDISNYISPYSKGCSKDAKGYIELSELLTNQKNLLNLKPIGQTHYLSGIRIQRGDVEKIESSNILNLLNIMLRKIMLVDYSSREMSIEYPSVRIDSSNTSDTFWESINGPQIEVNIQIHPMDVFLMLYLSVDPLFQRKILQKLAKCKLSLPLIISDPSSCQPKIFAFPLQSLSSEWKKDGENERARESIVFNEPMPIISFIRFGKHSSDKFSKSKILNNILGFKHDCFIHRNSPGSTKFRVLFNGTVELAWFLPKRGDENRFANPITFLNLRGNAAEHLKQLNFIQLLSSKIFLILWSDDMQQNEIESLRELYSKAGDKIVCLFPSLTQEAKMIIRSFPNIKGDSEHIFVLGKVNWAADITALCHLINLHSQNASEKFRSLAGHIDQINHGLEIDYNELYFQEAELEIDLYTKQFLIDSGQYGTKALRHIKDTYLVLQGKHWEDWCKLHTEGYRLKNLDNVNLEEYRSQLRTQMNECRNAQIDILNNINNMKFLYEILKICRFSFIKPFYSELFWNKLQLSLDRICAEHLPALYEEHNMISKLKNIRGHVESNPSSPYANFTQAQLKTEFHKSARNLSKSSLGMEHIIRELSQVFEAYSSASAEQRKSLDQKLPIDINNLPIFAANFLLQGYPLEILDGDVSHVPTVWLSKVLEHLKIIIGNKLIYVVSILGVQSSGKSTLLNTMFGLHFAVSAGRCTKGIFMQMIPVSPDLVDSLGYDYLVVLDTEGLRAPELDDDVNRFHDNELATFAIGLSHLTIINIMGENPTDMEDILQITVHAFLRMNLAWIKPRCVFVHQNVTSVSSVELLAPVRNALISKLNEMTEAAAKHEGLCYKYFSDLIQFNPEQDVYYFPGLYIGSPPMAPINIEYSLESSKLKSKILKMFTQFPNMKGKKISSFITSINQLWTAILHEKFIFHFKNIQEMNAQRELDYALSEWYYNYSQKVYECQIEIFVLLSNETNITMTFRDLKENIQNLCAGSSRDEQSMIIRDFFEVGEKVELFNQWESKTKRYFEESRQSLQKELIHKCRTEYDLILNQNRLSKMIGEIESSFVVKVKDFLKNVNNLQSFDDGVIQDNFEKIWKQWLRSLNIQQPEIRKSNIPCDLYDYFNSTPWYPRTQSSFLSRIRDYNNYIYEGEKFYFCKNHIRLIGQYHTSTELYQRLFTALSKHRPRNLDYYGKKVYYSIMDHLTTISQECKYLISQLPQNSGYNKNYFGRLDKLISDNIDEINKQEYSFRRFGIQFSDHFKREYTFYHCCKAIPAFSILQESYEDSNCIQTQLVTLKEKYFHTFKKSIKASESEKACSEHLADIVLEGMKRYLVSIMNKIAVEQFLSDKHDIVRSKGTIQLSILKGLINAKHQKFCEYLNYIRDPKGCMNNWFRTQFCEYSNQPTSQNRILQELQHQIDEALEYFIRAAKSINVSNWLEWQIFFQTKISIRVSNLRIQHFTVLDSYDIKNIDQLVNFFEKDIKLLSKNFNWIQWIKSTVSKHCDPLKQVMKTKLECTAMCPFCRELCQLSVGNHNKHYCGSLHRVDAVNGGRAKGSDMMFNYECTVSVRDGKKFELEDEIYPFSEMEKAGPPYNSWTILADDACDSKYWQWFTFNYEKDLIDHYGYISNPNIKLWKNITKEQVLQDLDEHYKYFDV